MLMLLLKIEAEIEMLHCLYTTIRSYDYTTFHKHTELSSPPIDLDLNSPWTAIYIRSSERSTIMCIPLIFGFPTKFRQDASEPGRMCPRCNNAAVVGGSSRTWFEFFWIPLIPFTKSRIWICTICQWEMKQGDGPDPQPPSQNRWGGGYRPPPPPQQSHQPAYGQQQV
ncbi:hypothetical protein L486_08189 [Kwoniella mangroviensis CBS 10435]|uniref:Zinc-ribbon 15 domain-containing protein n=1 Tax=Kwoniella mangroviensis CBS 10435 TaxID=1331196 RepID=A0A1B9IFD6_9TREE|nr:hypothetical protein L486_08189 [Kwoniella mangroviensis CBS 10435]